MSRNLRIFIGLAVAIALGLGSRYFPIGNVFWDLHLGDVVSGTAVYFIATFLGKRASVARLIIFSFLYCMLIEFFKLTGIPAKVSGIAPLRWLLGTTFSLHNLPLYLVGIFWGAFLDKHWFRK